MAILLRLRFPWSWLLPQLGGAAVAVHESDARGHIRRLLRQRGLCQLVTRAGELDAD